MSYTTMLGMQDRWFDFWMTMLGIVGASALGGFIAYLSVQAGARRALDVERSARAEERAVDSALALADMATAVRYPLSKIEHLFRRASMIVNDTPRRSKAFGESAVILDDLFDTASTAFRRHRHGLHSTPTIPNAAAHLADCLRLLSNTLLPTLANRPDHEVLGNIAEVVRRLDEDAGNLFAACDALAAGDDVDRLEPLTADEMRTLLGLTATDGDDSKPPLLPEP